MTETNQTAVPEQKKVIWVYLSGAMALTIVVMLFLPDTGTGSPLVSMYSTMLWCGIFGGSVARYIGRNGWMGFALGSASGMLIQTLSQII